MPDTLETYSLSLEPEPILHDSQQERSVNLRNSDGFSALHLAIQRKNSAEIDFLLARGANIHAQTDCGSTVLDLAFELKDISCMDYLLGKNPDINFEKEGPLTKLCINVAENDKPIIDYLLTKGTDFRLKDILFMDYLIEKGADINVLNGKGFNLLHRAVKHNDMVMIDYLLLRGADINVRTAQDLSVLDFAVKQNTIDYLIKKGANISLIFHSEPYVPTLTKSNNDQFINGGINHSLSQFERQLISYQQITTPPNVYLLPTRLSFFQSQHIRPDFLQYAKNGQVGRVFDCLYHNTDIDTIDNQGYTALLLAAKYGHIYMVNLLLDKKANVNHANHYGHTALHLATSSGYFDIIEMLIRFGADVHKVDNQYKTPLDIAVEFNHQLIIEFLENQSPPAKKARVC